MGNLEYLRDVASTNDRVLNIGSKYGDNMATINANTIATDIAFEPTNTGGTEYAYADGTRLPFKSNTLDYVYCNHVLEHIEQKSALVKETSRVLRMHHILF
ncbi:MAG: hypothetical protein BRD49_03700 [Bacteroidetes bacterium SW_10_40_5]|nr:MAG: hypothetical protein BRD49_03700 [Bacteroidetes bacterium SW_10_40_5]